MIREVIEQEKSDRLASIEGDVDRYTPFYNNPTNKALIICGAIRGLDVPIQSLWSLARQFSESKFFILCQYEEYFEEGEVGLIEISCPSQFGILNRDVYSKFPGVFTGDLVICWGESKRWYVIFNANFSLGVLLTRSLEDAGNASKAYSEGDELMEMFDAFSECYEYELRHVPEEFRDEVTEQLFKSWRIRKECQD